MGEAQNMAALTNSFSQFNVSGEVSMERPGSHNTIVTFNTAAGASYCRSNVSVTCTAPAISITYVGQYGNDATWPNRSLLLHECTCIPQAAGKCI